MRTGASFAGVCALAAAIPLVSDVFGAETQHSGPPATTVSVAHEPMTIRDRVRSVVAAVCSADDPSPATLTLAVGGAVELSRTPFRIRDRVMGVRHSLMLPDGARIRIDRIETEGILRRVVASYAEPTPSGRRPVLLAVAGSACNVMATITSLVQLTRMGSLAGFLDNSKSLLGIAAGLGLARHFRVPVRTRS